jgi:hypothetical protein
MNYKWFAYEKLTVPVAGVHLTAATYNPATDPQSAKAALIIVEADQIRLRITGAAEHATATDGMLLSPGQSFLIEGSQNIKDAHMIRVTNDATVHVHYGW